jgi:hypothetical protein
VLDKVLTISEKCPFKLYNVHYNNYSVFTNQLPLTFPKRGANKESCCIRGWSDKVLGGERGGGDGNYTYSIHMHSIYSPVQMQYSNWVFSACLQIGRTVFFQTMASSEICSKIFELKYAMWLNMRRPPIYGENPLFDS